MICNHETETQPITLYLSADIIICTSLIYGIVARLTKVEKWAVNVFNKNVTELNFKCLCWKTWDKQMMGDLGLLDEVAACFLEMDSAGCWLLLVFLGFGLDCMFNMVVPCIYN